MFDLNLEGGDGWTVIYGPVMSHLFGKKIRRNNAHEKN